MLGNLARVELLRGDTVQAMGWWRKLVELTQSLNYQRGYFWALIGIAEIAAAAGQLERAILFLGAYDSFGIAHQLVTEPEAQPAYDRIIHDARAALSEQAFADAWAAGRALSVEQAIALALGE